MSQKIVPSRKISPVRFAPSPTGTHVLRIEAKEGLEAEIGLQSFIAGQSLAMGTDILLA
jgi:hypothetical protein